MSKTDQDKSYFLAFCIEQYKVAKGMDGADVARLVDNGRVYAAFDLYEARLIGKQELLIS